MTNAQNEIKSTVIPNSGDVINRSTWVEGTAKDIDSHGAHAFHSLFSSYVDSLSIIRRHYRTSGRALVLSWSGSRPPDGVNLYLYNITY